MLKFLREKKAVSLLEAVETIAIISILSLPFALYASERLYGNTSVKEQYEVLSMLESRLSAALSMPFNEIPLGCTADKLIECSNGQGLDLRPVIFFGGRVYFELSAVVSPLSASAISGSDMVKTDLFRLDDSLKRLEITARWGENRKGSHPEQSLNIVAYKADL